MSDEYDGINGFTSGGFVFLLLIFLLAFMCSIGDLLKNMYGSQASNAWIGLMGLVILYLLIKIK